MMVPFKSIAEQDAVAGQAGAGQLAPPRRPLISVIIPSYNSARFVADAIESALAQTYSPLEILVVDDESEDDTPQVVAPYQSRLRYIRQENRGLSGARNRGIEESQGELLAFLDADDRWHRDKLALQEVALTGRPQVGLVHTDVARWRDETGEIYFENRNRHLYQGRCYEALFWGNAVLPSTVLVRRECLKKVGLFDLSISRPSTQDYDLWLRIARYYEFAYLDQPLIDYRVHEGNASARSLMIREDELYTVRKALAEDPELAARIGDDGVRRRLVDLTFDVGYLQLEEGDSAAAHRYFSQTLALRWASPRAALLWMATLLPPNTVRAMRRLKQRL